MANDKLHKLIDRLLVKTIAMELKWSETSSQEAFQVSFSSYSVEVEHSDNTTYMRIYNSDGKVLDWTSDNVMRRDVSWNSTTAIRKLEELYQLARRQALGVDKALDDLLSAIG